MSKYTPATFQPTIRPDWAGILSYLSDEEKGEILVALFKYPSVECDSAFWKETIKPDLDLQYETFTESCKAKSRGVRNRWGKISITDVKDMDNISIREHIDTERERERKQESKKENISNIWNTRVAPTEEEVLEYARQQDEMAGMGGFAVTQEQAQDFYDYYTGIGWTLPNDAKTPIVDWKPFLRKWVRNPRYRNTQQEPEESSMDKYEFRCMFDDKEKEARK